ncbi:MAG: 4Fe-4S binding protein [Candidatus Scalinduaceae bacterium]
MVSQKKDSPSRVLERESTYQVDDNVGNKRKKKSPASMNSLRFRWIFQIAFFILTIYIGWKFYLFVQYCETGGATTYVSRPPGVEAFLPIGAFMGLKYFLGAGKVDPIHPAGFVIFASILLTSLFFQRGFCSWICPVGTISEWEWRFGDWLKSKFNNRLKNLLEIFPVKLTCGLSMIATPIIALMILEVINFDSFKILYFKSFNLFMVMISFMVIALVLPFVLPRKIWPARLEDSIARAWKYSILAFFVINILVKMPAQQLEIMFTNVPFMKVADVRMLKFFLNLSTFAAVVILTMLVFSIFNKNYWCRYFCPYGAMIGVIGWASSLRIVRDREKCIDCGKCTKACPVFIVVENKKAVYNCECLTCYDCVNACPVNGALDMKVVGIGKKIHYAVYACLVVGLFVVFMNTARFTGYWYNNITVQEYMYRIAEIDSPKYQHKQGKFEVE